MVKIKLVARENYNDGRINISLEPFISKGTDKEQKAGTYLLIKVSKMLSDLENEINYAEIYKGSKQEEEDLDLLSKIGG